MNINKEEALWNLDYWSGKKEAPYDILTEQQSAEQIKNLICSKITTAQIEKCLIALDNEADVGLMGMDEMKRVLVNWLEERGFEVEK